MKKQHEMKGIPPAPACRTATLPAMEARMRKAFPPISTFRSGKRKKSDGK